jgi:hypothetical protein
MDFGYGFHGARAVALAVVLAAGCGGKSDTEDDTSVDTGVEDTAEDTAEDTGVEDTAEDTAEDTGVEDTAEDTGADVIDDTEGDGDAAADPYGDWPTDLPTDWPYETSSECEEAGGFCTEARWVLCPPGYEPIDPGPHHGCGDSGGTAGWCCVVAPPSECSASGTGNCIAAESCTGCWAPVDLDCEEGRVCCQDICD